MALIILVWAAAAAAVIVIATDTKVGPVLIRLSRGHGIHLLDVLVFIGVSAVASAVTWLCVRRRSVRGRHGR